MMICKRCKKEKQIFDFYKHSAMLNGHLSFCKSCKKIDSSNHYRHNRDKIKKYQLKPRVRLRRVKVKKLWDLNNKEYVQEYRQKYKTARNERRRERYKNDPRYRILVLLRGRMYKALSGNCRSAKTMELIGCSIEEFISHIESLFKDDMNWDNQGKWDLDHVKPCASFDLTDHKQQRECFNYTNLQPLWAEDNHRKGSELF